MAKHPTLAERNRPQTPADPAATMQNTIMQQLARTGRASLPTASSDLHSNGMPTLADRVRVEGYKAQVGKGPKKGSVPSVKPRKKARRK